MSAHPNRRSFLKKSMAATLVATPLVRSLEEYALGEQVPDAVSHPTMPAGTNNWSLDKMARGTMPMGSIGPVKISRLICGGNLISGWAHSRDLMYVSPLLKHYFTDEKIMETWALSEKYGINTMILNPTDPESDRRPRGGIIQ
jgi:hypothetical protein